MTLNSTLLTSVSQAYAYPRTPDMNVFEDLLLQQHVFIRLNTSLYSCFTNLLDTDTDGSRISGCTYWYMASLNWCVQQPRRDRWRANYKELFSKAQILS